MEAKFTPDTVKGIAMAHGLGSMLAALLLHGCAAAYVTKHRAGAAIASENPAPNSENAIPTDIGDLKRVGLGPSANIEVVFDGKTTMSVPAGETFSVRPTQDSVDPDHVAAGCRNYGITRADYLIDGEIRKDVSRANSTSCEDLAVTHSFPKPGLYRIVLTVRSVDDEESMAAMILNVHDGDASVDSSPRYAFRIEAVPLVTAIGADVNFKGICVGGDASAIAWNFGDARQANGAELKHAYEDAGTYYVVARCPFGSKSQYMQSSVSVVVRAATVPDDDDKDQVPDPDKPAIDDDDKDTIPDEDTVGGEKPGKDPGQSQSPHQGQ